MVRRPARAVGRDRDRRRGARRAGDGRRFRLYRLALHHDRRGECRQAYKDGIVAGRAADIVYSNLFTGVHGNYLRASIVAAGLDPDDLPQGDLKTMDFGGGNGSKPKAWKDIWGSGQGIGAVTAVESVADRVDRLEREYRAARTRLGLA